MSQIPPSFAPSFVSLSKQPSVFWGQFVQPVTCVYRIHPGTKVTNFPNSHTCKVFNSETDSKDPTEASLFYFSTWTAPGKLGLTLPPTLQSPTGKVGILAFRKREDSSKAACLRSIL